MRRLRFHDPGVSDGLAGGGGGVGRAAFPDFQKGMWLAFGADRGSVRHRQTWGPHPMLYPVLGMAAMAASVTMIFFNSLWGKPALFFGAIMSVGRPLEAR